MQDHAASIDRRVLDTLLESLDGDSALWGELLTTYFEDAQRLIAELEAAVQQADVSLLGKGAHTLKSTSLAFGAQAIAGACVEIQKQAAAGLTTAATPKIEFIKEEFARVHQFLSQHLQSL